MSEAKKAVQEYGFKEIAEPAGMINKTPSTITKWHKDEPIHFKAVMIGLKQIKGESND